MAYQDPMGYYMGYDPEEEERKRREQEAAAQPVTQKITYNPDGTQKMTISGTPQALSAANPNTPTVTGPVMPDQTAAETQRLQRQEAAPSQAQQQYLQFVRENESGPNYNIGYHYQPNAQGQRASTAYGTYGITAPAYQDIQRAAPQFAGRDITSLSPEEQDQAALAYRDVQKQQLMAKGQEPTEANLRGAQYAGAGGVSQYNRTGALAPGVDQTTLQNRMAGAGSPASGAVQMQNGRLKVVPQAQAAAPAEAMPQEPASPYAPTPTGGPGLQMPGMAAGAPVAGSQAVQRYQEIQKDPQQLRDFAMDPNNPQWLRDRASESALQMYRDQRAEDTARKELPKKSQNELAKILQSKSEEGNWMKMILLGYISPQLAGDEAKKLGFGATWQNQTLDDGREVLVKIRADGLPMEGYDTVSGDKLSSTELGTTAGGVGKRVKPEVSTQDVEKNGMKGRVVTEIVNGRTKTYVESGGKRFTYDSTWTPVSISTDAAKKSAGQQITLKYAEAIQAAKGSGDAKGKLAEFGINVLTRPDGSVVLEQNGAILAPDDKGNISISTPAGRVTSLADLKLGQKAAEADVETAAQIKRTTAKPAAEQVAASADTQNMLNSIEKVVKIIDSGDHNIGHAAGGLVSGQLTGERVQKIGEAFRTEDAKNTKLVMDTVQKLASEGLKALGSNPSTVDLEFWTKYKPDIGSDPAFVKDWMQSRSEDLKRRLNYAQQQVNAGGNAPAAAPVNQAPRGSAANPIKIN